MPRRSDNSAIGPIAIAVGVSLLLHLVLWPVGDRVVKLGGERELPRHESVIEIDLQPDTRVENQTEEVTLPGELVDPEWLVDETPPKDSKRVAEFDNTVPRERVARGRDKPSAPKGQRVPKSGPTTPPQGGGDEKPRGIALPLGGRRAAGDAGSDSTTPSAATAEGPGVGKRPSLSPRAAAGIPDSMRERWGKAGSMDAVEDVEEGDNTLLDTHRWKYASFFNRLRDDIAQFWDPIPLLQARDPDGRKNGTKTRRTRLLIILNADGSLHKVSIKRSSNVDYLDEEAIRAVRSAAPFPNPPQGMLDPDDGKLHVPFGFIIEMGKGRIQRYKR